ncbi:NeuD/PglB/VioB family sugar acetyltransferase [Aquimarina sp. RZ0]|uniref:NeuD/PglB/VioB family sugar acetyltransferase n=1 Tax=Aquimarina sp. RZ0 TaxID=2607730 RepID=UPI0011F1AA01|nr:NeuD/PglB/VioB family sugar acetyltransferase [Aquimarina sp. RZ0]KAA1246934.1 GNAT family N-acetyltransferase [Aquimarina sp. RZ0]
MEKVLVIGASGHAKVIVEAIELGQEYEVYGFIDSYKSTSEKVLGYEIFGKEEIIPDLMNKGVNKAIIGIGDNWTRFLMYEKLSQTCPKLEFISVIHPSAVISPYSEIGRGTVILASGIVNTDAVVGDFCIINTKATFGHDCIMKNFSSLASGATIGGAVHVGEFTAVSLGVTVLQKLSIGKHSVIGAGAVVTNDVKDYRVAYGVPAKIIRKRNEGESYLNSKLLDTNFKVYRIKDTNGLVKYKKILKALNNSSPFYKTELLDTLSMNEHQLNYFVLEKNGNPIIVMPFYIRKIYLDGEDTSYKDVTSPYGYSGPLFDTDLINEDIIKHFWRQVDLWYEKKKIISEFIRFSLTGNQKEYSGELIPSLKNVKGVIIDKEEQWSKLKSKVRNNYRKSLQEGLNFKVFSDPIPMDIIKDFYDIYIQTMHRNNAHSQYFHYIDYFKNFIAENPESVIIAMVYKDFKPISTELVLLDEDTLYSYLGGTLSDYFYTRPNDFLKIEIINWARQYNYKYYVLGGGRVDNDNLYKYKKTFFPNDEDIVYYTGRKIINTDIYKDLVAKECDKDKILEQEDIQKNYFPLYRYNE